jgi:PAS domain S-box-containing protein
MRSRSTLHLAERLVELIAIAAAYYAVGRLSLLLAIPPGYATAVWPASGIALAATLLRGYRVWPGILLGSFLINVWTSLDTGSAASIFKSIFLVISIGAGASLQAIVGALLMSRFVRHPTALIGEKDVFKFLLLGGPISCLVNATWGVTSLLLAGVIQPADYLLHWWTWWLGDTIGVIAFTPLVLIWAAKPQGASLRRQISVSLPVCLTFALVVLCFVYTSAWEQNRIAAEFERRTDKVFQELEENFDNYIDALHSIESFFGSSVNVGRQEFKSFVSRWFSRHPGIQALSWNPRVLDSERTAYEQAARRNGFTNFQITEQNGQGELARAAPRAEYAPVYYLEPYVGNESALGFDVASDPIRREALNQARDTGKPRATDPTTLVQDAELKPGFLVFLPIYRNGLPQRTPEERRRNLQGYATGAFRFSDLIKTSLKGGEEPKDVEIRLYDDTGGGKRRLLYDHRSQALSSKDPPVETDTVMKPAVLQRVIPFEMAGRRWIIQFAPTKEYLTAQRSWQVWSVLAGGLLFTGLLGAFLLMVTGRAAELQAINRDLQKEITDRKSAEEALRKSEARKGAILESVLDGIISMDHEGKLLEFNPAAEKMFRYKRADVVGKSMAELIIPPSLREKHRHGMAHYLATGEGPILGKRIEMPAMRADGTEFPVELSVTRIGQDEPPLFTGYFRDTTDQKAQEEIRRRSEELEEQNRRVQEANRLKSEFLANMSHELRTPLNAIIGFSELIHDAKLGPVSAEHKEYLGDILTSARHLLALINDVLDLAKVEAGKMDFSPEPINLTKLIGDLRKIFQPLSASKRLTVEVEVASMIEQVVIDPAKLKQVLYNYLSNAIKFTPDGGRVTVRALPEDPEHFRLEVEDTGIGIEPDQISKLFVEFQQLEAGITKKHQGTGLGLALTKKIVEAQGGRVGVQSTHGRGSLFHAVLPRNAEQKKEFRVEDFPSASSTTDAPKVLVIEDNDQDRNWLIKILADAGYSVDAIMTGTEGIAKAQDNIYSAVLLDLILPDTGGWDILHSIRANGPNQSTPVIVVTVVAEKGVAQGFPIQDYLVKPIHSDTLLDSLRNAGVEPNGIERKVLVVDDDPNTLKIARTALQSSGYRAVCHASPTGGLAAAANSELDAVILDLLMPEMDGFEFLERLRQSANNKNVPVIVWTNKDITMEEMDRLKRSAQSIALKGRDNIDAVIRDLQRHLPQSAANPSSVEKQIGAASLKS